MKNQNQPDLILLKSSKKSLKVRPFFWRKKLEELNPLEWEMLCDSCGQCCLVKIQDDETDEIYRTNLACEFLDHNSAICTVYQQRVALKSNCFVIDIEQAEHFKWLPPTCAYRLRYEGKDLLAWHPLLSGHAATVIEAGISIAGRVVCENDVPEEEHVNYIDFTDADCVDVD